MSRQTTIFLFFRAHLPGVSSSSSAKARRKKKRQREAIQPTKTFFFWKNGRLDVLLFQWNSGQTLSLAHIGAGKEETTTVHWANDSLSSLAWAVVPNNRGIDC